VPQALPSEPDAAPTDAPDRFLSLKRGATEIYFIRHADALPGADEVASGGYDDQPLSELGRQQAQALAERLRDSGLAAIYSSPLGRARQTAEAVGKAADLPVSLEPDLREVELGQIGPKERDVLSPEELSNLLKQRLREIAIVAVTTGMWSSIPGSEPSPALRTRITGAVDRLAAAHPGRRIAVVSHGGSINAYFAVLLGIERDYFFPAANTSISVARVKGARRALFTLNDIGHLRTPELLGFDPAS